MSSSLRLYHRICHMLTEFLPPLYKRRRDNLAWLMTGLHEAEHVHLSKVADCRPGRASLTSKTSQLRRFLANEAIEPRTYYRPMARRLIEAAVRAHDRLRLLLDIIELPGQRQVLMAALAYRRRALPLLWSVWRGKGVTSAETQIAFLQDVEDLLDGLLPATPYSGRRRRIPLRRVASTPRPGRVGLPHSAAFGYVRPSA